MQRKYLFTILAILAISLVFLYKTFKSPKTSINNIGNPDYKSENYSTTNNENNGNIIFPDNNDIAGQGETKVLNKSDEKVERKVIIKGRVVDIFGNGVSSVKVSWALDAKHTRNQSNYKSSAITTDEKGYFLLDQMYDAAETSEVSIKLYVNDNEEDYYAEQRRILLSKQLETREVLLQLAETSKLHFKVISDKGPVENASISIVAEPNFSTSGNTDFNGQISLTIPRNKQFNIICVSKGYLTWSETIPEGTSRRQMVEVYLKSGSGEIYGRCLTESGIPIKDVRISVWNTGEKSPVYYGNFGAQHYTVSDSNGYFTINNLPEGQISLTFNHPQYKHGYLNADTTNKETITVKMTKTYKVSLFVKTSEQMKAMKYGEDFIFEIKDQDNKAVICSWKMEKDNDSNDFNDFTSKISFEPDRHRFTCKFFNEELNRWEDYYTSEFIIYEDTSELTFQIQ